MLAQNHNIIVDLTGVLTGAVGALAVLLFISITFNLLCIIYCIHQLRMKKSQCCSTEGKIEEEIYEVVDEQYPSAGGSLPMMQNEAYRQIMPQTQTLSRGGTGL